ncbi:MOSC multi-domain protein [Pyrenophora tritici-repentis]|uniref:MOSC multi-domain protein n=2 Tax=Pyrenophora tritici-repentis TaxID=45151 RepID=A0A2W1CYC2_9PLEO|nr:3-chlorobenzoate-3,4-dioxygenase reductase subunit [Pyrenophora tritici-repentis Pt-1C-BFP]KAA8613808.1 MOSC multi-domain protein [Pyrenophora tritici-repentis]EDU49622.1 3-chlorobenzoate-3,4-dioxygenase reductase subunit [Pyrenophora tritici-repentis Pt-1C-BFP]KAF7445527.1 MOSC multi-domain protein [Pyrenophora tritici-repentis]KAF7565810.1 MOSC multi-domain protein [Pyrenophora tritici-repentis]KAG9380094.1 MOSC multi-domain protein [Pyrenophora tritici-repentis]
MSTSTWVPPSPPDPETLKNPPPFDPFPFIHVRTGKVKKSLAGGKIVSAIYKNALAGPQEICKTGIPTDEHAFHMHGGEDKALLHYCSAHYDEWKKELPASEHHFKGGAFGENLFNHEVGEKNICIGDRLAIGEIIVEVSEPRQPCFKLNHRFEVKNMAKRVQTLMRTGWMYRIIKTGTVNPGDMISLLERPHPKWTVARVMYYLFIELDNFEMMKHIVEIPQLGFDVKDKFKARLNKGTIEDQLGRMNGPEGAKMDTWNEYCLVEKRKETGTVTAFVFETIEDIVDPSPVEPGSHVRLKLGGKLVRAYSVVGGTSKRFELGIALDPSSRGGSKYMHENTAVGDVLTVGRITASFPLAKLADKHIIIAGGIGITAFLVALKFLQDADQIYQLHYAVSEEVPFASQIAALGSKAKIYNKSKGQRLDISAILAKADHQTHIYTCGPTRLMDAVVDTAKSYGIPESCVHIEAFTVNTSGDPFTVELKQSKKKVEVGPAQSLLDALQAVGMDVDSSCEVGNCGTCKVDVCSGRVEHRGTGLLDNEKEESMLSCVSRGVGTIVLDL